MPCAGSDLINLISLDELENLSNKYKVTDTPDSSVLTSVQVLVITMNEHEYSAVQSYLQPLSGNSLNKYAQLKAGGYAFYVIGKYGECNSAIRIVHTESSDITNVLTLASECFPNLSAIFIVGTITGVHGKVNTLDVLVSTNICTYEVIHGTDIDIRKKAEVNASGLFCELFSQPPKWPTPENKLVNHLKGIKPSIHQGSILCGPDVNKRIDKLLTLYPKAIGIDNDLFTVPRIMCDHIMLIKCVMINDEQDTHPTAALLAADCLAHYLQNPQLPQFLTTSIGSHNSIQLLDMQYLHDLVKNKRIGMRKPGLCTQNTPIHIMVSVSFTV